MIAQPIAYAMHGRAKREGRRSTSTLGRARGIRRERDGASGERSSTHLAKVGADPARHGAIIVHVSGVVVALVVHAPDGASLRRGTD